MALVTVVVEEMRFVMRNIGDKLTEEEIEEMLNEADQDHDGQISYDGTYCRPRCEDQ